MDLKPFIRDVPGFPEPNVNFKDITPLLSNGAAFEYAVAKMADTAADIDVVCGIDARGFIVGPPIALKLGVGFVPARKGGKLPRAVETV